MSAALLLPEPHAALVRRVALEGASASGGACAGVRALSGRAPSVQAT